MAIVTCQAVVTIPRHAIMLIVHVCLVVFMAINATEDRIISRIGVAIGTGIPFSVMFSRVYGKILLIVVERRGYPDILGMAQFAIGRKLQGQVRGIVSLVIIGFMAPKAGIGCSRIISPVARGTVICNADMGALQHVI